VPSSMGAGAPRNMTCGVPGYLPTAGRCAGMRAAGRLAVRAIAVLVRWGRGREGKEREGKGPRKMGGAFGRAVVHVDLWTCTWLGSASRGCEGGGRERRATGTSLLKSLCSGYIATLWG
jgi:hypothetical protein